MIVEDETLAQQVIQGHLEKTDQLELVAVCSNAIEAKEVLEKKDVDLIFLDIQLPGMTGFTFLRSCSNPPLVILTTAYAEYALESYDFNVVDYLLKPISLQRFTKAISKISDGRLFPKPGKENEILNDHIFIKSGSKFFKVDFSEIVYIQSMKDYAKIYTKELKLITHQKLSEIENLLPRKQFMRVHKSFIVAVRYIKTIYGNTIELNDTTIPIGESYKSNVMNLVGRKT